MWITVGYSDKQAKRGIVSGIYQTSLQAEAIVDIDRSGRTDMFAWPTHFQPRVGDHVAVDRGEVFPERGSLRRWLASVCHGQESTNGVRPPQIESVGISERERAGWRVAHESEQQLGEMQRENEALRAQATFAEELSERLGDDSLRHSHMVERRTPHGQQNSLWISRNTDESRDLLLADFHEMGREWQWDRIMIAPDEPTAQILNRLAQEKQSHRKLFKKDNAVIHEKQSQIVHVGDRVIFYRDDQDMGVREGDLGDVVHLHRQLKVLFVMPDHPLKSEVVCVDANKYPDFSLGYATTPDHVEKLNVESALILATPSSPAAKQVSAVSASCVHIYADTLTAQRHFSHLMREPQRSETQVVSNSNPLKDYLPEPDPTPDSAAQLSGSQVHPDPGDDHGPHRRA